MVHQLPCAIQEEHTLSHILKISNHLIIFSAVQKKCESQTVRSTLYSKWWRSLNFIFWNISAKNRIKVCCSLKVHFKREDNTFTVWLHKTLKIQVTKLMFIQYGVYFLGQTNCHVYTDLIISLLYFSNHLPTALSVPHYKWPMIMKLYKNYKSQIKVFYCGRHKRTHLHCTNTNLHVSP